MNRGPKAQRAALMSTPSPMVRVKKSVLGQMFSEMKVWLPLDASLRRSYVGKGHGGQKRAFKVKFLGEGVNDYGGPYRAVFEQVVDELQAEGDSGAECLLPFLKPSPNRSVAPLESQLACLIDCLLWGLCTVSMRQLLLFSGCLHELVVCVDCCVWQAEGSA